LRIWRDEAFFGGNTVLRKLKEMADNGDIRAIELYLKFILELTENLDIKSGGQTVNIVFDSSFKNYGTPKLAEDGSRR
jgi:hypothetical protein